MALKDAPLGSGINFFWRCNYINYGRKVLKVVPILDWKPHPCLVVAALDCITIEGGDAWLMLDVSRLVVNINVTILTPPPLNVILTLRNEKVVRKCPLIRCTKFPFTLQN